MTIGRGRSLQHSGAYRLAVALLVPMLIVAVSPCQAAATSSALIFSVPDYVVSESRGYSAVSIPGGSVLAAEEGRPRVPSYSRTYSYPAGVVVQDVVLVSRAEGAPVSGLRLEPVVLSFYADPPAEATPGWYPTITHSWNFRRAADGSGTLNLTVYPFCYEAASDEGQFFDSFTFRITTATTTLRIDSITPNEVEVIQGTPLAADVLLTNTGVAQDVVVRATVGPGGGATAEHTVLSRVLRGLAGQASLSLEWGTSGVPAGSYALAVELRDTAGNLLEVSALDFAVLSGAARFVIGQASYSVGGVSHAMDVAPYINSSRTFLPVRFVGYACGVAEQDISWDQMTRTATLRKGGVQLNLQIGSRALRVVRDGVPTVITMDVAPELTAGRTMLPVRWVAEQLGYTVGWDEPSRAVTLTP